MRQREEELVDKGCRRIDEVFAVIDDEHGWSITKRIHHDVEWIPRRLVGQPQRTHHSSREALRILHAFERHEPAVDARGLGVEIRRA